jgi:hypothetical protein
MLTEFRKTNDDIFIDHWNGTQQNPHLRGKKMEPSFVTFFENGGILCTLIHSAVAMINGGRNEIRIYTK